MERTLDMSIEDGPGALVENLRSMGFTPLTHPNLVRDMRRAFMEALTASGFGLEDQISVMFRFDENGVTGAEVTKRS